jgi:hypothetical protein
MGSALAFGPVVIRMMASKHRIEVKGDLGGRGLRRCGEALRIAAVGGWVMVGWSGGWANALFID